MNKPSVSSALQLYTQNVNMPFSWKYSFCMSYYATWFLKFPLLEFYISKESENKKPTHNKIARNAISSIYFDTEAQLYNIR